MIETDLLIQLKPALADSDGTIHARTYPLVVYPMAGYERVRVSGVSLIPNFGVVEVWTETRRQTITGDGGMMPAEATHFRPLRLTLVNLNPDSAVELVIRLAAFPSTGGGVQDGGAAAFSGPDPLGTDGSAETVDSLADTDGGDMRAAAGSGFRAWLTVDGPLTTRTIRQITGQTRILSPSGTGSIPTSGGDEMTLIIKKDGVVLEANTSTLNLLSTMFQLSTASQEVSINDFAAGAIKAAALAGGAVTAAKIAAGAVGTTQLADGGVTLSKLGPSGQDAIVWDAAYDAIASGQRVVNSPSGVEILNDQHTLPNDGRRYWLFCVAGAAINAGDYCYVAARIRSGGSTIIRESSYIGTGTVGGERWYMRTAQGFVTGSGEIITMACMGKIASVAGSFSGHMVSGFAVPIPFV